MFIQNQCEKLVQSFIYYESASLFKGTLKKIVQALSPIIRKKKYRGWHPCSFNRVVKTLPEPWEVTGSSPRKEEIGKFYCWEAEKLR